jgi:ABC-2 type transport system ATP-binding protein
MLQVRQIAKTFGPIQALQNVTFDIRPGEILGLIGPNGAGKSTLFECLAGIQPADSGTLLHDGDPVPPKDRHKLLYYVPDGIAPWPAQPLRWIPAKPIS